MARNELVVTVDTGPFVEVLAIVERHLSACIADLRAHAAGQDGGGPPTVRDLDEVVDGGG